MCGGLIICEPTIVLFITVLINIGDQGLSPPGKENIFPAGRDGFVWNVDSNPAGNNFPFSIDDDILTIRNLEIDGASV